MASNDPLSIPAGVRAGHVEDRDAFGRVAEATTRGFGTPRYLGIQTVLVAAWIVANGLAGAKGIWDAYPFKMLNLVFSTQAAYAAPMILLAQNRQGDRDAHEIGEDRSRNARSLAHAEYLGREIGRVRSSLAVKLNRDELQDALDRFERALDGYLNNPPKAA